MYNTELELEINEFEYLVKIEFSIDHTERQSMDGYEISPAYTEIDELNIEVFDCHGIRRKDLDQQAEEIINKDEDFLIQIAIDEEEENEMEHKLSMINN